MNKHKFNTALIIKKQINPRRTKQVDNDQTLLA